MASTNAVIPPEVSSSSRGQDEYGVARPTREVRNHMLDSRRWNDFVFCNDDVVTATWAKSGTTWVQQIIGQLLFKADEHIPIFDLCPWMEHRPIPKESIMSMLEAQAHRRIMKTHLPADALPLSPLARYLYIARDGRDVVWSWYNHHRSLTQRVLDVINNTPDRVGPPLGPANDDVRQYFIEWLEKDGYPVWPFWSHVRSWWDVRHRPNVLLVHFNRLKADLPGEIRRIAAFLNIAIEEDLFPRIVEHCGFDYMKAHAATLSPLFDGALHGGASAFIYKGTNGRWRDVLSSDDIRRYQRAAEENLPSDCAHWLATGEGSI